MRSIYLQCFLVVLTAAWTQLRADSVDCVRGELSLLQKVGGGSEAIVVASDSFVVPKDVVTRTRIGNVVFDIDILSLSDGAVTMAIEMVTSGPLTKRVSDVYTIPFGLPVILDSVIEKGESFYRATLRPLGVARLDIGCAYDMADSTAYSSDPAPHYQIYFVQQSLGDYHWNAMRGYLEMEYESLDRFYKFDDSQPVNLYLMPCRAPSLAYEVRHGFMIDPVRNSVFAVYSHEEKAEVSFASNKMKFYRYWGYAPLFFVEGVASFADFNDHYVGEYVRDTGVPNLESYFVSDSYCRYADEMPLRRIAGSFCTYLAREYDISRFRKLYGMSTDLTASADLAEVYGKPLDSLIAEWANYLDTLTIDARLFGYHAQRASYLREYDEAVELLNEKMERMGETSSDASQLGGYYFRLGDYPNALRFFGMQMEKDGERAGNAVVYANMLLINGMIDSAYVVYERVLSADSTEGLAAYKLGRIFQYRGDIPDALRYLHMANEVSDDDQVVIDAQLAIGECMRALGNRDSSDVYFASALSGAKLHLMGGDPAPLAAMRAGESFAQLGQPDPAIEHLEFARFVEERPYYLGRIALALGQAHDLRGNREEAIEFYQSVRRLPGDYLQCAAADRYIEEPFALDK